MPLPVIMLMGAAAAGTAGAANGVKGAQKMYESNKDKKMIEAQHAVNTQFYEKTFEVATKAMDELGEFEIMIMSEFQDFSDVIEKIENRPKFGEIKELLVVSPQLVLQQLLLLLLEQLLQEQL